MSNPLLFVGTKGTVVAYDKTTGQEFWRQHLKGAGVVLLGEDASLLYAHTGGHLYAVEKNQGTVVWENPMKGLGYGLASLAGVSSTNQSTWLHAAKAEEDAQAAAAAT